MRTWFRRVWDERDPSAIDEIFVPEGPGAVGLAANPIGPKEFRGFWDMVTDAIADTSVTIDHILVQGEQILLIGRLCGTHIKTAKALDLRFAAHSVVRNGKIVDATNVLDSLTLLQQLGACDADALPRALM